MINRILANFFLATILLFAHQVWAKTTSLNIMPYPQSVKFNEQQLAVPEKLSITIEGMSQQRSGALRTLLTSQVKAMGWQISAVDDNVLSIVFIVNNGKTLDYQMPALGTDEGYQLDIRKQQITITAATDFGALHGAATLSQLLYQAKNEQSLSAVSIKDAPRFPWRGFMLDSVRHFMSIDTVKRQLRGMAAAKLNVFHWHLTDDQGWRIALDSYPKLHQLASDGQFYTKAEIRDVVKYASSLGIRVVPEFDVPGHASAIAVAYPHLMSEQKDYQMEDGWGVFEPLLDPSNLEVYIFIDSVVKELTELFPDQYLHIGGDEVDPEQWNNSLHIQTFMQENDLKDAQAIQVFFNQKVEAILASHNRKMMGWDEVFHQDLPQNIMVQSWRGMESLSKIAVNGYQGLLSTGFYIDQPQSSAYHYRNELLQQRPRSAVQPAEDQQVVAYQFEMPRLKGSAVKGTLAMVMKNDYVLHAYVKLNNNHFKKATLDRHLVLQTGEVNFSIDSWMGPTRGEFLLTEDKQEGRILIGNTYYPVSISSIDAFDYSQVELLPNISPIAARNILGGEATLWSELVTDNNVDLRAWPRLFVIAERFWSAKSQKNIDNMFTRLVVLDDFASQIGMQHRQQYRSGLQSLVFSKTDISPLVLLAEQLEPANYYTRHHIKFQQGKYHQNAPLNRFVDYLPVESTALIKMRQQLKAYQQGDKSALQAIVDQLRVWHFNFDKVVSLIKVAPKLDDLPLVVQQARDVNTLALTVAQSCLSDVKIRRAEAKRIKNTLRELHRTSKEIIVASNLFTEQLLAACRA
ncbi:beta-N-acetylhexosaminidase [Thalassotalea sediminis]|uniref:beta-N-acetylhexosaminidase n=1 Tax=Thalassotalea sediminis TaxID=1759089 RepID=UPI002572D17B|nr:family 20 glycosylhydrolase [Thalassotalea sediminis]